MIEEQLETICDIIIEGDPVSLKRHRHYAKGNEINTYDPNVNDKDSFSWKTISKYKPNVPFNEPLFIDLYFFMRRPKSHFMTGKNKDKLKKDASLFHDKKPDLDNLIKFVKDALNGIFWRDDSVIVNLNATKIYSLTPKVRLILKNIRKDG